MLIKPGDKIRINVTIVEENGMDEHAEMMNRFQYILDHPDDIYEVSDVACEGCLAPIRVTHPILGATSFFEDEVILLKRGEDI